MYSCVREFERACVCVCVCVLTYEHAFKSAYLNACVRVCVCSFVLSRLRVFVR